LGQEEDNRKTQRTTEDLEERTRRKEDNRDERRTREKSALIPLGSVDWIRTDTTETETTALT
jgi:hypothetical protein